MKSFSLTMGFEIKTSAGSVLKPTHFSLWDQTSHFSEYTPHPPFKFKSDALTGLHFQCLNQFTTMTSSEKLIATEALQSFCPYAELYKKSHQRLKSALKIEKAPTTLNRQFEKTWEDFFAHFQGKSTWNLTDLTKFIDSISDLETGLAQPLLYNFSLELSEKTTQQLLSFYSFLFHLRSLIAVDHNAHVDDTAFESVSCDSISDYLPKADFTSNDALLYWQFKKLATPFVGHKDKDIRIEKLLVDPLYRAFQNYNHNACALIDQLPQDFLNTPVSTELEEALHHIQMDWLLGSSAGLLFRIREELFGLSEGYDQIFWPEASHQKRKKASSLKICFELKESDFTTRSNAA